MHTSRKISLKTAESSAWKNVFTKENSANAESVITFCRLSVLPAGYDQTAVANGEIEVRIVAFLQRFHQNRRLFQAVEDFPAVFEAESLHAVFLERFLGLKVETWNSKNTFFFRNERTTLCVCYDSQKGEKEKPRADLRGFPRLFRAAAAYRSFLPRLSHISR